MDKSSQSGTFFNSTDLSTHKDNKLINRTTDDHARVAITYPDRTHRCGLFKWRPLCLEGARTICAFLAATCFASCLQASFAGYSSSLVTTLEKRFAIGSTIIGMINSSFEVGYVISVIFVSYAGSRGHVPFWLSAGLFTMSIGSFVWMIPHSIFTHSQSAAHNIDAECSQAMDTSKCYGSLCPTRSEHCVTETTSGYYFLPIFLLAQILLGVGSTPILTLAPPFIDDHVDSSKASTMIAAPYAAAALGPVFGFALSAWALQYPHDMKVNLNRSPDDPDWIGAWWVGFIILGILLLLASFVMALFPRKLRTWHPNKDPVNAIGYNRCLLHETERRNAQLTHRRNYSLPEQDFVDMLRSLAGNKIYIFVCLGVCSEMFLIIGFSSFLPKYLEIEYHLSKWTTNLIAGGLIVPSGAIGIFVGGLIFKHIKLRRKVAIRFVILVNFIIMGCIFSFFFIGCDNPSVAGITVTYPSKDNPSETLLYDDYSNPKAFFNSTCNAVCKCDPSAWEPVCDVTTRTTFISPCYAGCAAEQNVKSEFTNCKCAVAKLVDPATRLLKGKSAAAPSTGEGRLQPGQCDTKCRTLPIFVPILTLTLFLTGVTQNPLLMVTMRSVKRSERSFSLGLQFVIMRVLANLPSPILFGRVIDGACRFWRSECGRAGDCAFVDLAYLNWYMIGLSLIVKATGFIFYFALLWFLRSVSEDNEVEPSLAVQRVEDRQLPTGCPDCLAITDVDHQLDIDRKR